jgi:uncharacterized membrane protein
VTGWPAGVGRAAAALLGAATTGWLAAILLAPMAIVGPDTPLSMRGSAVAVYLFGRQICHQRAERSFHVRGVAMPVCARCTGLYAGLPLGVAASLLPRRIRQAALARPRRWFLAASVPTLVSVGVELLTGLTSEVSRAAAAVPLAAAVSAFVAAVLTSYPILPDPSATLPGIRGHRPSDPKRT